MARNSRLDLMDGPQPAGNLLGVAPWAAGQSSDKLRDALPAPDVRARAISALGWGVASVVASLVFIGAAFGLFTVLMAKRVLDDLPDGQPARIRIQAQIAMALGIWSFLLVGLLLWFIANN